MRHLGSIVLSLLLGPIIYLLIGIGLQKTIEARPDSSGVDYVVLSIGLAALVAAGLLYALLLLARLSPLGLVLLGLGYFGVGVWALFAASSFVDLTPTDIPGIGNATVLPAGAVTVLLSMPLLATVFSPRRWRRWATPPAAVVAPGYPPPGATPPYPTSYSGPTGYQEPHPTYPDPSRYPAPNYSSPISAPPAPTYAPPAQADSAEETAALPTPGTHSSPYPPGWQGFDQGDPEATRRLP